MRTAWGIVYAFIAALAIGGIALAIASAITRDIPWAAVGAILFTMGVALFRVSLDISWLKGAREDVDAERTDVARASAVLMADRTVFERERLQTLHQLDEQERRSVREIAEQAVRVRAQLADERKQMLTDLENKAAKERNKAFATGFHLGRHGVAPEIHDGNVIMLPAAADTMMGTGTLNS